MRHLFDVCDVVPKKPKTRTRLDEEQVSCLSCQNNGCRRPIVTIKNICVAPLVQD